MSRGPGRTLQEEIQEEFLHGKGGQGWEGAAQGTLRNSVALRALVWLIRWCLIRGWTRFWTFFQPKLFHSVVPWLPLDTLRASPAAAGPQGWQPHTQPSSSAHPGSKPRSFPLPTPIPMDFYLLALQIHGHTSTKLTLQIALSHLINQMQSPPLLLLQSSSSSYNNLW